MEHTDAIVESLHVCNLNAPPCFVVFNTDKGKLCLNAGIEITTVIPKIEESIHLMDVPHDTIKTYIEKTKEFLDTNPGHFVDGVLKGNNILYESSLEKCSVFNIYIILTFICMFLLYVIFKEFRYVIENLAKRFEFSASVSIHLRQ